MNLRELKKIITLFEQRNLIEMEYEEAGVRVRLRKESSNPLSLRATQTGSQSDSAPTQSAPSSTEPALSAGGSNNLIPLRSPIVGTFYRAPAPDAPPLSDTTIGCFIRLCF